ncbi:MAG: bifunctional 5,10-methylene-tetrahydrofolate dehydrogenase/5,10-methylene-tetrahydrofolate cyclohydrolase, partial [Chloroflexi bacterium]
TRELPAVCREADILVAAIGRAGFVDASFVKPGACVIDVGINRVDGRLTGDVDRASVEPVAGWLTPVPKGVGPMTIAMLMRNAVDLAEARRGSSTRC